MIHLYPANKMEYLLALLDKIQQVSPLPVFAQETIVVQNPGMQHWLNLSLANERGISMNIRYALPAQFLWKLMRSLASDENVPDQSPYSREVLTWRIYSLLASDIVCQDQDFEQATRYWQGDDSSSTTDKSDSLNRNSNEKIIEIINQKPVKKNNQDSALKRYQLALQLADLYEQYLIFRPEWINQWHHGVNGIEPSQFSNDFFDNTNSANGDSANTSNHSNDGLKTISRWQGKLWQLLTEEQPYNPLNLLKDAVANIPAKKSTLPHRLSFFGINAMAPMWLDFIHALSKHLDVHFFHLNPCYAYWGDILSEKQAMKAIDLWVNPSDTDDSSKEDELAAHSLSESIGNPLLANLGQQGREFMALLQSYSTVNIELFEALDEIPADETLDHKVSVLSYIQQDILSLSDRREQPIDHEDDSIIITSCHSALREVQALHDWLLHQFNQDSTMTPKDVLVMCPQIESYAPFVNAVFTRGWQAIDDKIPPLPCSIADRSSKDAEPVIAAFTDILNLPDSRFSVTQLIALLRLPAMQIKFDISLEALDKITLWLDQASIHWGLDQNHKQKVLASEHSNNSFTWQQGLSRLLRGFAFGDNYGNADVIYQNALLLPSVEGDDAQLLGQLCLIIEQLQFTSFELLTTRTPEQWQKFLLSLLEDLFDISSEQSFQLIEQAIAAMVEYCGHAKFTGPVDLSIVKEFLNNHFSQPDPGRQFMVGQVTFCSMLPMRSIPFKVIAVLGLNDGEFPRQRQPLGFDLMELTPPKLGDRSRRGDDRYLFLEAIISARQSLYLSYQGKNIKTNKTKEASLVLKELMDYLQQGFNWQFDGEDTSKLRQMPMQPFSDKNYQGKYPGFDAKWLAIKQPVSSLTTNKHNQHTILPVLDETTEEASDNNIIDIEQLVSFYQHPSRYFARQQLNLFLDQQSLSLDDVEPFAVDRLESYLIREDILSTCLSTSDDKEAAINKTIEIAKLKGSLPDLPNTNDAIEGWKQDAIAFSQLLTDKQADNPEYIDIELGLSVKAPLGQTIQIDLTSKLPIKEQQVVFYRSSSGKDKDFFKLYIHHLVMQIAQDNCQSNAINCISKDNQNKLSQVTHSHGYFYDPKSQSITEYTLADLPDAKQQLTQLIEYYLLGQEQPLLLNSAIAHAVFKGHVSAKKEVQAFTQTAFELLWQDPNSEFSFGNDPYLDYFWSECPDYYAHQAHFEKVYLPLYTSIEKLKPVKTKSANIKPLKTNQGASI